MKNKIKIVAWLLMASLFTASCNKEQHQEEPVKCNSIYHWKTTFDLDSSEISFLKQHHIKRIYVRMFDVATEFDSKKGLSEIVPIATTKFISRIPNDIDVVPVTYITLEALRAMSGKESEYASLIVERLLAMGGYNKCGEISEIQLDCDWTASLKAIYSNLCKYVKTALQAKNINLSITVRLHQLSETPPPADKGVLMLYNTGALKDPETKNSILNINDVKPYLKQQKYPLYLSYAYPTFGWGVKFKNNSFVSIISADSTCIDVNERIRYERASADEIFKVKELVEKQLGKPENGNILYHLDYSQLKNYSNNEIDKILSF